MKIKNVKNSSVEMTEVKSSFFARLLDNFVLVSKFLCIVSVVLILVMSCGKASAEEMASNQQEVIEQYILDNFGSSASDAIAAVRQYVFPYCEYFGTFSYTPVTGNYTIIFTNNLSVMPVYAASVWSSPYSQIRVGITDSVGSRGGLVSSSGLSVEHYYGFRLMIYNGTWGLYGKSDFTGTISNKYGGTYFGGGALNKYAGTSSTSNSSWFNGYGELITTYGYGPVWLAWDSDHQMTRYGSNNTEPVSYVSDDRLRFSTVPDAYGDKYLWVDLTKFLTGTGSRISYELDYFILTLDIDGTEVSFRIPDTYLTNNTTNSSGSGSFVPVLRYQIPFSYFNFADDIDVSVIKCSFTLTNNDFTDTSVTEFKIACSYPLQTTATNAPTGAPIAVDPDTQTNKITNITYNEIVDKVNFQEGYYSPEGGGGNPLVVPDGYTVKYVTITGTRTLASIIQTVYDDFDVTIDTARDVVQYITGISQTDAAERFIEDSVRDNHYTQSYDIVVYFWAPDASLGEVDVMYYYLTEAGRIRGISQIVADIYRDVNQTAYNTFALYDFLYQRLNDFEDKTLASLYEQLGVSKGIQSTVTLANATLVDILNAINGLDIPVPSVDYTGLLQSILQALGNLSGSDLSDTNLLLQKLVDHFNASGSSSPSQPYLSFVSWLNTNDVLRWVNSSFLAFDGVFDYFDVVEFDPVPGSSSINDYFDTLLTYLKFVTSGQVFGDYEYSTVKLNNYFGSIYDGSYNPHDVYGGGNS